MTHDFLVQLSAFACVSVLAWLLMQLLTKKNVDPVDRFKQMIADPAVRAPAAETKKVGEIVERATPMLSKLLHAKDRRERQQLKLRLGYAGFNATRAVEAYLAIKGLALIGGALLGSSIGFGVWGLNQLGFSSIIVGAALGLFVPEIALRLVIRRRQLEIAYALPEALDLMVICADVGQGLDAAIVRVARELGDRWPDLGSEFNMYLAQVQMGRPRREALRDLGVRSGVDEVNAFASIIAQADKFGSSISQALRDLSDMLRLKRRQQAEEKAQKTAVHLLFPLILFIFPGIFVILVGPAAISLMTQMDKF